MKDQLHILIVDDDQRMAKTLKDILKVKGHVPRPCIRVLMPLYF